MTMTGRGWVFGLLAAAALAACDGGSGSDAGTGTDAATPNLPPIEIYEESAMSYVATGGSLGCFGTRTAPVGGAPVDVRFELRDFQDGFEVVGAEVWLFGDNVIADDCTGGCQRLTTDAMGNAAARLPAGGWYAYRVLPLEGPTARTTVFGVFQYNKPTPASAGGAVDGNSVSGSTIELIPALLGITREPGRAIVAGRVHDCVDTNNVRNVQIRIYDPDGNYIEPGTRPNDPRYHYFMGLVRGNVPDQTAEHTAADGLYVAPQVPLVDDRPYRVEAWANFDGAYQRYGCETARLYADSVTILNIGPMRADPDPACR